MSVVDRFRNRENLAMVFTLQFPPDEPAIEFTVRRLSQSQLNVANIAARDHVKDNDDSGVMWTCYELCPQLVGHITGWRALDGGEMPQFNRSNLQQFLDSLTIDERVLLGLAYVTAANKEEENKKKEVATSSEPAS